MSAKARPKAVEAWALYDEDGEIERTFSDEIVVHPSRKDARVVRHNHFRRGSMSIIRVSITPAPTPRRKR